MASDLGLILGSIAPWAVEREEGGGGHVRTTAALRGGRASDLLVSVLGRFLRREHDTHRKGLEVAPLQAPAQSEFSSCVYVSCIPGLSGLSLLSETGLLRAML